MSEKFSDDNKTYFKLQEIHDTIIRLNTQLLKKPEFTPFVEEINEFTQEQFQTYITDYEAFKISILQNLQSLQSSLTNTILNNPMNNEISSIASNVEQMSLILQNFEIDYDTINTELVTSISPLIQSINSSIANLDIQIDNVEIANNVRSALLDDFTLLSEQISNLPTHSNPPSLTEIVDAVNTDLSTAFQDLSTQISNTIPPTLNEISMAINDTLATEFDTINNQIINIPNPPSTQEIATSISNDLALSFDTINNNILQLSSEQASILTELEPFMNDLAFIVAKRRFYEPITAPPPYDQNTLTVNHMKDKIKLCMQTVFAGNNIFPSFYFLTENNSVYSLCLRYDFNRANVGNIYFNTYLDDQLVDSYSFIKTSAGLVEFPQNFAFVFLSSGTAHKLTIELNSTGGNNTIICPELEIYGINATLLTSQPRFSVSRFINNYIVAKFQDTEISTISTPISTPNFNGTSLSTCEKTEPSISNYLHFNNTNTSNAYKLTLHVNLSNQARLYSNGNYSRTLNGTYKLATLNGYQSTHNTHYGVAYNTDNEIVSLVFSTILCSPVVTDITPITEVASLVPVMECTNDLYSYINIFGITYANGDNYIYYSTSTANFQSIYMGKGSRWRMGLVKKSLLPVGRKHILRSYMKKGADWVREEFLITTDSTNVTITRLDAYYVDGEFDFIHCGTEMEYICEVDGNPIISTHPYIDYTTLGL